jgi:hypothetical protein
MPRQPFLKVVPRPRGGKYDLGTNCIGQRPELEKLYSACVMLWPFIEAEMAVLLGQLLGADNPPALAVFQSLRRSSSQREAIGEAAKVSLNEADRELVGAVLNIHKSTEAERNALVHGHFGTTTHLPDALIWQNTSDYVTFRASFVIPTEPTWSAAKHLEMLSTIWVYRKNDLEMIYADIKELSHIWHELTQYLRLAKDQQERAEAYRRLCDQSRVAQELENIRRKNNP